MQHSLQGPLLLCGQVAGTVNFARSTSCGSFHGAQPLARARDLRRGGRCTRALLERAETIEQLNLFKACFADRAGATVISDAAGQIRALNGDARNRTGVDAESPRLDEALHRLQDTVACLADSPADSLAVTARTGEILVSVRCRDPPSRSCPAGSRAPTPSATRSTSCPPVHGSSRSC